MSSIHGKKDTVFRKKKTSTKLSSSPTFTQDYKFAHQATAGDTTIDLDNLNLPAQMTEFVNPTGTELAKINLKGNANSLILVSSIGKTLICDVDYKINTSRIIELQYEAAENEIFTGQMRITQATSNILDGETYTCTGTLTAGQVNIALGQAFTRNANPSKQIGDFVLYIDGVQQFRNAGNAAADSGADGNYEESDAGAGLTNSVEMNEAYADDVAWAVVSTGVIVDNSNISNQQQLDALAGQIDSMVPHLATVAGVPESTFQSNPNSVDLKAFGDKLFGACADIDKLLPILDKEVTLTTREIITYSGYISKDGGNRLKFRNIFTDSGSELVADDNGGNYTIYTFSKECDFTASLTATCSGQNNNLIIELRDSGGALKLSSQDDTNATSAASLVLSTKAEVGDYLQTAANSPLVPADNTTTSFSVIATKVETKKISELI